MGASASQSFRELDAKEGLFCGERITSRAHLRHGKVFTRGASAAGGRADWRARGRHRRMSCRAVMYLAGRLEICAARALVRVGCDAVRTEGALAYWALDLRMQREAAARGALSSTIHLCHAEI